MHNWGGQIWELTTQDLNFHACFHSILARMSQYSSKILQSTVNEESGLKYAIGTGKSENWQHEISTSLLFCTWYELTIGKENNMSWQPTKIFSQKYAKFAIGGNDNMRTLVDLDWIWIKISQYPYLRLNSLWRFHSQMLDWGRQINLSMSMSNLRSFICDVRAAVTSRDPWDMQKYQAFDYLDGRAKEFNVIWDNLSLKISNLRFITIQQWLLYSRSLDGT